LLQDVSRISTANKVIDIRQDPAARLFHPMCDISASKLDLTTPFNLAGA